MFRDAVGGDRATSIADRLLNSSGRFAKTSMEAYVAEAWDVFYLHLSTAVEQLLKSVLADTDPTLIADRTADFETMLHLTGHPEFASVPESAVKTVNVTEAIKRVSRIAPDYRPATARVTFLLDMRNGIVHAGHSVRAEHQAVLGEVASFVGQFLATRAVAPGAYWGPNADLVSDLAQRRIDALEASYHRKVRSAQDSHEQLFEPLSVEERDTFLASREPQDLAEDYDEARVSCPACGHVGTITGHPEPQWEADYDSEGGEAFVAGAFVTGVRLYATSFRCGVCSLQLDADSLSFAGIAAVELTDADVDLEGATEYFTRQLADDWYDE